jgi:hypothetical protein
MTHFEIIDGHLLISFTRAFPASLDHKRILIGYKTPQLYPMKHVKLWDEKLADIQNEGESK